MRWLAVAALILIGSTGAKAQACIPVGGFVQGAFLTGQQWLDKTEAQQIGFVDGFFGGLFLGTFLGASEPCMARAAACIKGKTDGQLAAMARKYINEHPEDWQISAHILLYQGLLGDCLK